MRGLLDRDPYIEPYRFVEASVRVGDFDEAFIWLEVAYEARSAWFPTIAYDPLLEPLHSDPRFAEMLRLAGHETYLSGDSRRGV
jgi:hypothetical protein